MYCDIIRRSALDTRGDPPHRGYNLPNGCQGRERFPLFVHIGVDDEIILVLVDENPGSNPSPTPLISKKRNNNKIWWGTKKQAFELVRRRGGRTVSETVYSRATGDCEEVKRPPPAGRVNPARSKENERRGVQLWSQSPAAGPALLWGMRGRGAPGGTTRTELNSRTG